MDPTTAAIVGLNATLVGVLVWALKTLITRLFGDGRQDRGAIGAFLEDLEENTKAIRELRDYQRDHARAQVETKEALRELLVFLRAEKARRTAADPR
jgi:hypothetical protein